MQSMISSEGTKHPFSLTYVRYTFQLFSLWTHKMLLQNKKVKKKWRTHTETSAVFFFPCRWDQRRSHSCCVWREDVSCWAAGQWRHGVFTLHEVTAHSPTIQNARTHTHHAYAAPVLTTETHKHKFYCVLLVVCAPDYSMSLWPLPADTLSASNVWSAAWTTTPTAPCARRTCLRYSHLLSLA